jgi:hypothetical protein
MEESSPENITLFIEENNTVDLNENITNDDSTPTEVLDLVNELVNKIANESEVVEEPAHEVVEEPAPEVVEESVPEVVEEPAPEVVEEQVLEVVEEQVLEVIEEQVLEVVEEPAPEVVEEPAPEVVEEPAPEVVEEPVLEVVEESAPEVVEEPALEVVEEPAPEVVEESAPEVVEESAPKVVEEPAIESEIIPKLIFIVPYRDREQQLTFFVSHMKKVLEDMQPSDYKIYYIHQKDTRDFNRGAMKNIGFLAMKAKYPNDYQNITFVFNDVDTMPFTKDFLNYDTVHGVVKHFYGYKFSLGGIVSIKGSDFERVNGFPNFWAWGFEDNLLQLRVLAAKLVINRDQFYPIMDKNIIQMKDGLERVVNRTEFDRFIGETNEGIQSLNNLQYNINDDTMFVDVNSFSTGIEPNIEQNKIHDIRNGSRPFPINNTISLNGTSKRRPFMSMRHF